MTIQELGSLGELIAAIATLATLLYLALQVRQNTEQLKNTSRDSRTAAATAFAELESALGREFGLNPQAAHLYFRGLEDFDALGPEEQSQFQWQLICVVSQARQSYHLHQEGVLDPGVWNSQEQGVRWAISQPGFRAYWDRWGDMGDGDFWTLLRGMVEEQAREEDSP